MTIFQPLIDPEIWNQLANEIGGQYQGASQNHLRWGGVGRSVHMEIEEWFISLEEYRATPDSSVEHVRMRAPYQDKDGFRFALSRKDLFSEIAKLFGMQDVEIGDAVFDDEFIIKGNDGDKVRAFFASPRLRQLAQTQPYICLQIREGERPRIDTLFGESNAELHSLLRHDQTKDLAGLKSMFEMVGEALRQLRRIGSA